MIVLKGFGGDILRKFVCLSLDGIQAKVEIRWRDLKSSSPMGPNELLLPFGFSSNEVVSSSIWFVTFACRMKKSDGAPESGGPKEQGGVVRLKLGMTEIHWLGLERTKSKNHNQNDQWKRNDSGARHEWWVR